MITPIVVLLLWGLFVFSIEVSIAFNFKSYPNLQRYYRYGNQKLAAAWKKSARDDKVSVKVAVDIIKLLSCMPFLVGTNDDQPRDKNKF